MQSAPNPAKFLMFVMKLAFLASALGFVYIAIKIPPQPGPSPNPAFEWLIAALALIDAVIGLNGRRLFLWMAKRSPRKKQVNPLGLWMTGNVLSLAFMQSCILFGLVLHFVGTNVRLVEVLFAVGILSLLSWSPGTPPSANNGMPFRS